MAMTHEIILTEKFALLTEHPATKDHRRGERT
jgi:hypothetical protein